MAGQVARPLKAVSADEKELYTLEEVRSLFEVIKKENARPRLVSGDGESIELPESLYRVLRDVVPALLSGESVAVAHLDAEVTTQEAADILNMSRQHFVTLLENGELDYRKVGTHRRVRLGDVFEYAERTRAEQEAALDAIALMSLEEGMYEK